jgi:TonB family protein
MALRKKVRRPRLACMKHRWASLILAVAVACFLGSVKYASAQSAQSSETRQVGALLTKLSDPTYPRLALQARIAGDVDLMLTIRRDGSVESAVVVSGHPLLRQAALDSAQKSQFECRVCGEAGTSYALKYEFQIVPRDPPRGLKDCETQEEKQPPAELDVSRHQVTVVSWGIWTCDPAGRILKIRSAKCLYLWRCGTRDED